MSFIYISDGFIIYPHRHLIERDSQSIQVRPKTFALLLMLLERPHEVLSKRDLLETIWDDVNVEEPVLVQSIREIRQLFGNPNIIQTHPRKGYAWAADVQKQSVQEHSAQQNSNTTDVTDSAKKANVSLQSQTSHTPHLLRRKSTYWIAFSIITVISVAIFFSVFMKPPHFFQWTHTATQPQTDVVIVLPVKNKIPDSDHDWVYLGAMDQLIGSLTSTKSVQVMESQYVLNLMQHAEMPKDYSTDDVARVFGVSGATLAVESQLSGSVEEYRLEYKLHFKNDIKRGVILEKNLPDALHKLCVVIAGYTGQSFNNTVNSQNAFTNELMARALEKFDVGDYDLARSFLTSLKQLEPDNIVARELLIQSLVRADQLDPAIEEINATIQLAKNLHTQEHASLHTALAIVNIRQGRPNDALKQLDEASKLAIQNNDVLYQAYSAQIRGSILQQSGDFALAQKSFEDALKYHNIIRCPVGIALTNLDLAKLFAAQGKTDLANTYFAEAKHWVEDHKLHQLTANLNSFTPNATQ